MTKPKRLSVGLPTVMLKALESRAESEGQSKASVIRSALSMALKPEIEDEVAKSRKIVPSKCCNCRD